MHLIIHLIPELYLLCNSMRSVFLWLKKTTKNKAENKIYAFSVHVLKNVFIKHIDARNLIAIVFFFNANTAFLLRLVLPFSRTLRCFTASSD